MSVYGASATRDRQGWFFGLTGPQFFLVLAAGFPSWLAIAVGQWIALLVLVPLWAWSALLICLPVRGWSASQWIGVLVRHLAGAAFGWSRFQSKAAAGDLDLGDGENDEDDGDAGEADLPGVLAGIQIHDGPPMTGQTARPAIIQNHATRTWAATARIVHPGIGMSDDADRFRMGAGLAELLRGRDRRQPDRPASRCRSAPSPTTAPSATSGCASNARPDEPEVSARIHAQLEAMTAGAAVRTRGVRDRRGARGRHRQGRQARRTRRDRPSPHPVRRPGRGRGPADRLDRLHPGHLARQLRARRGDPHRVRARRRARARRRGDPPPRRRRRSPAGVPVAAAGPTNASTALRSYRHGEWESISSTILLPRKGALMGALARVLVPSQVGERRALTVFYRPVSQQAADRATGRAEMSAAMAGEMRAKVGRVERAKDRQSVGKLHETDEKLETGRSLVKVSSAVSVTVPAGVERPGLRPPPRRLGPPQRLHPAAAGRRPRRGLRRCPRSRWGQACRRSAANPRSAQTRPGLKQPGRQMSDLAAGLLLLQAWSTNPPC